MSAASLPHYTTPEELAAHFGVPERTMKEKVREIGACSVIGKKTICTDADVQILLEAMRPCHSKSTSVAKSGITAARLPEGDYAALQARLTKASRKGSQQTKSKRSGNVVSMGRGQA